MTHELKCTICKETIVQLLNPVEPAVCDIFAYHHKQHTKDRIIADLKKVLEGDALAKAITVVTLRSNGMGKCDFCDEQAHFGCEFGSACPEHFESEYAPMIHAQKASK